MIHPTKRIGRRRFALIYLGGVLLKMAVLIAFWVVAVKAKAAFGSVFFESALLWLLMDACMLPSYAGRLKDVALSPYCLLLLYGGFVFWMGFPLIFPDPQDNSSHAMDFLFNSSFMILFCLFSMIWLVGLVLRIFLIFKKGEFHGIS